MRATNSATTAAGESGGGSWLISDNTITVRMRAIPSNPNRYEDFLEWKCETAAGEVEQVLGAPRGLPMCDVFAAIAAPPLWPQQE